jgi:hypothetical protein
MESPLNAVRSYNAVNRLLQAARGFFRIPAGNALSSGCVVDERDPSRWGGETGRGACGRHPEEKATDLGIISSVWLDPAVLDVPEGEVDHAALFRVNREATAKVIRKAMRGEPTIDWLLVNRGCAHPASGAYWT